MPTPIRRITPYKLPHNAVGEPDYVALAEHLGVDAPALQETVEELQQRSLLYIRKDRFLSVAPRALREEERPRHLEVILRLLGYERTDVEGIVKRRGLVGGRAHVVGTRIPVWQIARSYRKAGDNPEPLYNWYPELREARIDAALEYCRRHPDEVEEDILDNRRMGRGKRAAAHAG